MEGKKAYNYSVIIPHKNIPELLERCIASVPERDDVQLVVVDDNSDPAIVDFGNFPGIGRQNTEIIFAKGEDGRRGAGYARNLGMDAAKGRWLVFADADDMFLPAIADMMDRYRDSDADIVILGNDVVDCDTMLPNGVEDNRGGFLRKYLENGDTDLLRYTIWAPWAKFVKLGLVENSGLRFSEIEYSNDLMFSIKTGHHASGIVFDPTKVYSYGLRRSSLTGQDNINWDSLMVRFNEDIRVAEFLNSLGKGSYFGSTVVWRWKHLMRADRNKAKKLFPEVKRTAPPGDVRKMRLKLALDPVVMPLRKLFAAKS